MLLRTENATVVLDWKEWKELEITATYTPL